MAQYHYKRQIIDGDHAYNLPNPERDIYPTTERPIQPWQDIYDAIGIIVKIEGSGEDFIVTTPEELDAAQKAAMDTAIINHENNLSA